MCECLELRVMRCHQGRASAFEQVTHDRTRQRRAFLRISACSQFIKDDERARINMFENANNVSDMTTECTQRLLNGLLITDISVDIVETRQSRSALRRNVQSTLRHKRQQANSF